MFHTPKDNPNPDDSNSPKDNPNPDGSHYEEQSKPRCLKLPKDNPNPVGSLSSVPPHRMRYGTKRAGSTQHQHTITDSLSASQHTTNDAV
ncbi:hypothetical protein J6590_065501 [Homalodisca vitripennis]|nr:hypothetical protein J6590_065501 [Homalodisca vitripennis]